jgi:hypothetical protein
MSRTAFALALALVLAAGPAMATQQGVNAMTSWKTMDSCAKQAQARFPDFNADSNARRDEMLRQCLESNNLPPRQLETPQPPR